MATATRIHTYDHILGKYEERAKALFAGNDQKLQELEALKQEYSEGKLDNYAYREDLVSLLTEGKHSFQSDKTASKLKALANGIQENQNEAQKQRKELFKTAVYGFLFLVILGIIVTMGFAIVTMGFAYVSRGAIESWSLLTVAAPLFLVAIIYLHILFRFYQQSISLQKELLEKQLGIEFLEAVFRDSPSNLELYKLGMQMFLQHHVSVEPYGAKDKIVSINLGKMKDE